MTKVLDRLEIEGAAADGYIFESTGFGEVKITPQASPDDYFVIGLSVVEQLRRFLQRVERDINVNP